MTESSVVLGTPTSTKGLLDFDQQISVDENKKGLFLLFITIFSSSVSW